MIVVTVSGMVGSGKSTVLRHVASTLERRGISAALWNFQRLPCFTLRPRRGQTPPTPSSSIARGRGYRRRRLTATLTVGYLVRMAAFVAYRWWSRRERVVVVNRFFYDNLVHYELNSVRERLYAGVLTRIMPRPDVAILLLAEPSTIAARRPTYSSEYVACVQRAYRELRVRFPEVIEVRSDAGEPTLARVDAVLQESLGSHVQPAE